MRQVVQIALAIPVGIVIVALLLLFGLALDDVFGQHRTSVETPFGSVSVDDQRTFFKPLLLIHVLLVPAVWKLCTRVGYPGWFGLAMLIPFGNVLLLYFLAAAQWPVEARRGSLADLPPGLPAVTEPPPASIPMVREDNPATFRR